MRVAGEVEWEVRSEEDINTAVEEFRKLVQECLLVEKNVFELKMFFDATRTGTHE